MTQSRRTIVQGIGVGLVAQIASEAQAQGEAKAADMSSGEYWTNKGDVKLYLYRKRVGAPKTGESLPVLFLVHGSSISSRR